MDSLEALYFGIDGEVDGLGLHEYVAFLQPGLQTTVAARFTAVRNALALLDTPLQDAVVNRPNEVQALYDALQELLLTTKVDMTNVMGVTITFNDNDGD